MSIEGLKEQARRHEQKEEWRKALDLYRRAIEKLDQDDQPDIGLYNRVGDLYVRVGDLEQAVAHYERAVDLYVEAELPNNAIAICKKIVRNAPSRSSVHLRMGRIRAAQGFLTDARDSFLTYAERVQASGDTDEALRALEELAELSPGDADIRISLARQLHQQGRPDDALVQLRAAHAVLVEQGDEAGAHEVEARAREIDPSADLSGPSAAEPWTVPSFDEGAAPAFQAMDGEGAPEESDAEVGAAVEDFEISPRASGEASPASPYEAYEPRPPLSLDDAEEGDGLEFLELGAEGEEEGLEFSALGEEEAEEADELPMLDLGEGHALEPLPGLERHGDLESEGFPLPLLEEGEQRDGAPVRGTSGEDGGGGLLEPALRDPHGLMELVPTGEELPDVEVGVSEIDTGGIGDDGVEPGAPRVATPRPAAHAAAVDLMVSGDLEGAERLVRDLVERDPLDLSNRQRLLELAFRKGDVPAQAQAYLDLARCLEGTASRADALRIYQQILRIDPANEAARAAVSGPGVEVEQTFVPVASSEDYVDLGALVLDEPQEATTRFTVAYEEPTGDDEADFARMLRQFKDKVAENLATDDVRAHHDLGTAYKEMGLVDEAIGEFQAALRASRDHLPSYELLAQCFMEKERYEAAIRCLGRALDLEWEVEDELIGIYYYLGRAYEAIGKKESAVEYFDRVFTLDINFMDVTERLRALR